MFACRRKAVGGKSGLRIAAQRLIAAHRKVRIALGNADGIDRACHRHCRWQEPQRRVPSEMTEVKRGNLCAEQDQIGPELEAARFN